MTWRLFGKLVQLLMKEKMEYRADFILNAFAQIINYGATYIIIWLFIKRFDTIAGWAWPEIALLYSIGLFTYAIGASFTFVQMREIESHVRSGTFDGILTKPANPYLYVICRGFNLAYIAHVIISGSVLVWSLAQLHIDWSVGQVAYFVLALISGALIQAGLMSMIGASSFFWVRNGFLFSLFFRLKDFINYPVSVYNSFIQIILIFIVPLAFVNFFPSVFLLGKQAPMIDELGTWIAPLMGPLFFWIGYRFFMYGVNKYQGAGG